VFVAASKEYMDMVKAPPFAEVHTDTWTRGRVVDYTD
jgi:hypothetical protein